MYMEIQAQVQPEQGRLTAHLQLVGVAILFVGTAFMSIAKYGDCEWPNAHKRDRNQWNRGIR